MRRILVAIACTGVLVGCGSAAVTAPAASPPVRGGDASESASANAQATVSPSSGSLAPEASRTSTPPQSPSLFPLAPQRDLFGTKAVRQTAAQMSAAVNGAFQSKPNVVFASPWGPDLSLASATSAVKGCVSASLDENKNQASARASECASLVAALYTVYRLSGEEAFYEAALVALNYGRTSLPYGYEQVLVDSASHLIGTADHELECAANPGSVPVMPSLEPGQKTYVIEPGDGGSRIAVEFGLTIRDLIGANPHVRFAFGQRPGCAPVIAIGDTIIIPKPGG